MKWNQLISSKRLGKENSPKPLEESRTEFQRDFDRLIFSAAFRRMQNKTQVFPLPGSIFVHNRLTHSLEVSSVGRSLGTDVSRELLRQDPALEECGVGAMGAIVSAACLAHDMGNPPFGHSGESAIRTFFSEGPGRRFHDLITPDGKDLSEAEWTDMTRFDGNANTFRLLTHHFQGKRSGGFVMTYSTLASIVKYPIGSDRAVRKPKFGYFESERLTYQSIADELGIRCLERSADGSAVYARHPLVYLVEAADDICYEIMDIEDAHKLKILSTEETQELLLAYFTPEQQADIRMHLDQLEDVNEKIVYLRSIAIGILETDCVRVFVENEEKILAGEFKGSLIDHVAPILRTAYKNCVKTAYKKIYHTQIVVDIEISGYKVMTQLLELMCEAVTHSTNTYSQILLNRVSSQYDVLAPTLYGRLLSVLDYISGMTDVFALDLYRKINGISIATV